MNDIFEQTTISVSLSKQKTLILSNCKFEADTKFSPPFLILLKHIAKGVEIHMTLSSGGLSTHNGPSK